MERFVTFSRAKLSAALLLSRKKPLGAISALILLLIFFMAVSSYIWTPSGPFELRSDAQLHKPSLEFPLGTDNFGRDVLSRIMRGSRFSLYVAFVAVIIGSTIGAFNGLVSGYLGGKGDAFLERIIEIMLSIPPLVLALALASVRPSSNFPEPFNSPLNDLIIAIGFLMIPRTSRVIRSVALSEKGRDYVQAARALGARDLRIILRHIAPQCFPAYIVIATAELGTAVIIEASLSFLGLGVQQPEPSWGNMISGRSLADFEQAPWVNIFPGIALSLVIYAFNLAGDSLRDILDPRLRS